MLSPDDIAFISGLCRRRAGLKIDPARAYPVESRLSPLARREGMESCEALIARVRGGDERLAWMAVEAMAQAETSFFRDRLPFEQFESDLLPNLAKLRGERPISVWSAACATGQEVYSLAMTAARLASIQVDFFASDLAESALRKAQSGLYTQFEIQRGLPARMLVDHFEKSGEAWRISDRMRAQIRWRRVNLISDLSGLPRFDIIFCRNLLSLLDDPFRARVLESLAARLAPDGVLVLGLKETAQGLLAPVEGRPGLYRRELDRRAA